MRRIDTPAWPCTIAHALLGDHWNVPIIPQVCLGTRRFDDVQRQLGIGRNIRTMRLTDLVDEELLQRVPYREAPTRHEYRPADEGREAYPIFAAMAAWGDRSLTGPEGSPLVLHHTTCGHDMHAVVVGSECDPPLDVREVRATVGTGHRTAAAEAAP